VDNRQSPSGLACDKLSLSVDRDELFRKVQLLARLDPQLMAECEA
jgi:hypothetical protein